MKKKYKIIIPLLMSTLLISTPLALTSCGSVSKELIDKSISKKSGDVFAISNDGNKKRYDLEWFSKETFKSDTGQKEFVNYIISRMAFNWFKKASEKNSELDLKRRFDAQIKAINDEYNETYKNSKNSNGVNFPLKFQQDVLDQNGGTEQSWKEKKLLNWAKSLLTGEIFRKSYLGLADSSGNIISNPVEDQLLQAVSNEPTKGYKFVFDKKVVENKNDFTDKAYAKFQEFVFNEWLQIEAPFIINTSLWKYGVPVNGINSIYNENATKIDETTSKSSGTYNFPYFDDVNPSHSSATTVTKMKNFINDGWKSNFVVDKNINELKNKIGLRDINPKLYSDDSSSLLLVKNSTIYNDVSIELAAASSQLFAEILINGDSSSTNNNKLNKIEPRYISSDYEQNIKIDFISDLFISDKEIPNSGNSANNKMLNQIKLSQLLVKQIINNDGPLKGVNDIYTIDGFKGITNQNTNTANILGDFIFTRAENGVYAVSIEGQKYLSSNPSNLQDELAWINQVKKRSGDIILYHALNSKNLSDPMLSIDINNELSSFFNQNTEYLIAKYIIDGFSQNSSSYNDLEDSNKLFDYDETFNPDNSEKDKYLYSDNSYKLFIDICFYIFVSSNVNKRKEYNEKMMNQKQNYANNFGVNTKKNGFASRWFYWPVKYNSAPNDTVKNAGIFQFVETVIYPRAYELFFKLKKEISKKINQFFIEIESEDKLEPLKSAFEGFKYSQYIYTNKPAINWILYSSGIDGNVFGDLIKIDILKNQILYNDFVLDNNKNLLEIQGNLNSSLNESIDINQQNKLLNKALTNVQYSKTFNDSTNKWIDYLIDGRDKTSLEKSDINEDELNTYKKYLYIKSLIVNSSNSYSEILNTLLVVATSKYLLSDEQATEFLNQLKSNVNSGDDSYVGWSSWYNSELTPKNTTNNTNKFVNVDDLLSANKSSEGLSKNINNAYDSPYTKNFPHSPVNIIFEVNENNNNENNNNNNNKNNNPIFVDNSSYYNVVDGKLGFNGLITESKYDGNQLIKDKLFNLENYDNSPFAPLSAYGNETDLINLIKSYQYQSEVINLAEKLRKKTKLFSTDDIVNATSVDEMKKLLIDKVENISKIPNLNLYKPYNGYVGEYDPTNTNNNPPKLIKSLDGSNIEAGADVFQMNYNSFNDWSSFTKIFDKSNNSTGTPNSQDIAWEVIYNLVFDVAKNSYVQDNALTSLLVDKKVQVFDVRLNNQLGAKWVSNWKS